MLSLFYRRLHLDALYRLGHDALDRRRFRVALAIAAEAERRRNTMAYEVRAQALWGMGRRLRAVEVLWEATQRHPAIHPLWGYLGEYLSDLGHLDDATAAFMRAGEVGASPCTTDYNLGVISWRRGRFEESVRYLESALAAYDPSRDDGYTPDLLRAETAHSLASAGRTEGARRIYAQVDRSTLPLEVRDRVEAVLARAPSAAQ